MNFASPEDADLIDVDEISQTEEETVALALHPDANRSKHSLSNAIESAAAAIADLHGRLDEAESMIEEQEAVIEDQQDTIIELETQLESLTETLAETQDQGEEHEARLQQTEETLSHLQQLEGAVESMQTELDRIDQTATEAADRAISRSEDLCVIQAALFDEEYPCPSCSEGTISHSTALLDNAVACDACDFTKKLRAY